MADLVARNDARLDQVAQQSHDTQQALTAILAARDMRASRNWAIYLILITILLTQIAQIVGAHL